MRTIEEQHRCGYCEEWKVVPLLARECEARHENEKD